jgi:hypothetical protein
MCLAADGCPHYLQQNPTLAINQQMHVAGNQPMYLPTHLQDVVHQLGAAKGLHVAVEPALQERGQRRRGAVSAHHTVASSQSAHAASDEGLDLNLATHAA